MLFKVELASGGPVFVYVLAEHKSLADHGTPLQLAGYMIRYQNVLILTLSECFSYRNLSAISHVFSIGYPGEIRITSRLVSGR